MPGADQKQNKQYSGQSTGAFFNTKLANSYFEANIEQVIWEKRNLCIPMLLLLLFFSLLKVSETLMKEGHC